MTKQNRRQRGIAGVEFALILPVFMLVLFAITEFGLAFYKQQIITSAAREAARYGIVATDPRPDSGAISARATDYISNTGLDGTVATVTVSGAGGFSGDALKVLVEYPTSFALIGAFMKATDGATSSSLPVSGVHVLAATIVVELE